MLAAACGARARAGDEGDGPKAGAGTVRVEGLITYDGPLPDPIPVPEAGTMRHLVVVDPKTRGLKDAVVWLDVADPATRRRRSRRSAAG